MNELENFTLGQLCYIEAMIERLSADMQDVKSLPRSKLPLAIFPPPRPDIMRTSPEDLTRVDARFDRIERRLDGAP